MEVSNVFLPWLWHCYGLILKRTFEGVFALQLYNDLDREGVTIDGVFGALRIVFAPVEVEACHLVLVYEVAATDVDVSSHR